MELFTNGNMDKYYIAARIFKQFGKKWNVPDNELHTAMIDLSITCAEEDYKNSQNKVKHSKNNGKQKTSKKNSNICIVHNCIMVNKKISIIYGMPAFGPPLGYEEAKENNFPNCDDEILGGCCVEKTKYKNKYVCKECNDVRDSWKNYWNKATAHNKQ